jgi:hypothetical protein
MIRFSQHCLRSVVASLALAQKPQIQWDKQYDFRR